MKRGLLNDRQIAKLCLGEQPMIKPFIATKVSELRHTDGSAPSKIVSFGLGSSGYDIRLGNKFGFLKASVPFIDPKHVMEDEYEWNESPHVYIQGNDYILAKSMESFDLPANIVGVAVNKSTLARVGIFANITPLESGWRGVLTIEIANLGRKPVVLRAGEGIAQILFYCIKEPLADYAALGGKYQNQTGVQVAK